MDSEYQIIWTDESVKNLESILDYLNNRWTEREVNNFKAGLSKQLELISSRPLMFPKSELQPRLRKAVLSKQTTIFYEFRDNVIFLAYIFNTAQNPEKIR